MCFRLYGRHDEAEVVFVDRRIWGLNGKRQRETLRRWNVLYLGGGGGHNQTVP